jgi:hypothetical protein
MKTAIACAALLALIAPEAALAQGETPTTIHDVQCLLMAITLAGSGDPDAKAAGLSDTMYFGGKIFGAEPNIDLPSVAKTEATKLDNQALAVLQDQCGNEIKTYGTKLQAVGTAMP